MLLQQALSSSSVFLLEDKTTLGPIQPQSTRVSISYINHQPLLRALSFKLQHLYNPFIATADKSVISMKKSHPSTHHLS